MDSHEKKLFARFDSSFPAERANAVELLHAHLTGNGRTFRDIIAEIEQSEALIAKLKSANERWRKSFAALVVATTGLRNLREWIAFNRKRASVGAVVLVAGAVLFHFYGPGTGPAAVAAREATEKAMHELATRWNWGEGESEPHVYTLAGHAWWVIARGDTKADSHADATGQAVELHCIHLYARPAEADSGAFLKPVPRSLPWGWFSWSEQAVDCKVAAIRKAEK
jgi:hypothetical protein